MKNKINKYKLGGKIPKYGMGAQVGSTGASMIPGYGTAISAGLNIGGMYNDSVMNEYGNYKTQFDKNLSYLNPAANFDRIANGDVGRGIVGTLTGPLAGGILESTGAMDAMFGKSQGEIAEEKARQAKIQFGNYKNIFGKGDNSTLGIKTNNQSMYANGGMKIINNDHFNPTEDYIDAPELNGYFRKRK
jgi:hypothetical protein